MAKPEIKGMTYLIAKTINQQLIAENEVTAYYAQVSRKADGTI